MSQRSALILGASGLVGSHCLQILLRRPEYERVFAAVRRPLGLTDPKLTEVPLDDIPLVTDVFCALGTTIKKAGSREAFRHIDCELPRNIARYAASHGARRFFLVSSVDAEANSSNFYLRVKAELEDAVAAMPFESVEIFRPSFLIGDRPESRPVERWGIAVARALQFSLQGKLRKYRPIPARTVAAAMVAAALEASHGRRIHQYDEMMRASTDSLLAPT